MTTEIAEKLEYILSGTGTSQEEFNEIIDLMEEYKQLTIPVVRHSCEMITEEYIYKNEFRFQRTQKHGIWFVTYQNHLITFGQYRHDLEQWIDSNYAQRFG